VSYLIVFFREKRRWGSPTGAKDLDSAKKFAESTLLVNGADSFAIYDEDNDKLVFMHEADAKKS
jgi:hypothetical protein